MSSRTRTVSLALLGIVVCAAGIVYLSYQGLSSGRGRGRGSESPRRQAVADPSGRPAASLDDRSEAGWCRFDGRRSGRFSFDMTVASTVAPFALAGLSAELAVVSGADQRVRIDGVLEWFVDQSPAPGSPGLMRARLTGTRIHKGAASKSLELPAEAFMVKLAPDCAFTAFGFPPEYSAERAETVRGFMSSISVALPNESTGDRTHWIRVEVDDLGQYTAEYRRVDGGEDRRFVKRSLTYDRFEAARELDVAALHVTRSHTGFSLNPEHGWLAALEGEVALRFVSERGEAVAGLTRRVVLKELAGDAEELAAMALWAADLDWQRRAPTQSHRAEDELDESARSGELTGLSVEELLGRFQGVMETAGSSRTLLGAHLVRDYLRDNPERAWEVMALALDGRVGQLARGILFLGLELSGVPQARDALVRTLSDSGVDSFDRTRAALALGGFPNSREEVADKLLEISQPGANGPENDQEVRNAASLGLGMVESQVRETNPELAEKIVAATEERLSAESATDDDLISALGTVANSGNERFLDEVAPLLGDDNSVVRGNGVEALMHMSSSATAPLFASHFGDESRDTVRELWLRTLENQSRRERTGPGADAIAAALQQLPNEAGFTVKIGLIKLLGPEAARNPEVMTALVNLFHSDPSVAVKKTIGSYVSGEKLFQ